MQRGELAAIRLPGGAAGQDFVADGHSIEQALAHVVVGPLRGGVFQHQLALEVQAPGVLADLRLADGCIAAVLVEHQHLAVARLRELLERPRQHDVAAEVGVAEDRGVAFDGAGIARELDLGRGVQILGRHARSPRNAKRVFAAAQGVTADPSLARRDRRGRRRSAPVRASRSLRRGHDSEALGVLQEESGGRHASGSEAHGVWPAGLEDAA